MIHDLELTTVIDVQGTLTPVLTDEDKAKLDKAVSFIERKVIVYLIVKQFKNCKYQSSKLAIMDVARRLNASDEDMSELIRMYIDEL